MRPIYTKGTQEYEPPTLDQMAAEVGSYQRGQEWVYRYPRHIPNPPHTHRHSCQSSQPSGNLQTPVMVEVSQPKEQTLPKHLWFHKPQEEPSLIDQVVKRTISGELAMIHRASICERLERRLQLAKQRGDEVLLRELEKEAAQLICC